MSGVQDRYQPYLDDQRRFFDALITEDWHTYREPLWDRARMLEVGRIFEAVSPRSVLDVGCGCGFHDVAMANQLGVESVEAIDYSPKSIEVAEREFAHPAVTRRVGDVFEIEGGEFDLVVSFQVIEHLRDAAGFLRRCSELTRPGGAVAVVTPNRSRLENRYLSLRGRPPAMVDPQHFQEFSLAELRTLGESVGLVPRSAFGHGFTWFVPRVAMRIVPRALGLRIGGLLPDFADVIGVVFVKPSR